MTALRRITGDRLVEVGYEFDELEQVRGHGKRVQRTRVADTLRKMRMALTISEEQYLAGHMFRVDFQRAHLIGIRPAALEKIDGSRGDDDDNRLTTAERCGRRIFRDIRAMGGMGTLSADCMWDVVGCERSVREWASIHGVQRNRASGILITALTIVAVSRDLIVRK